MSDLVRYQGAGNGLVGMVPFSEMQQMAEAVAGSKMFGMQTPAQALTLMLFAQAEGMHPMCAVRDYHIFGGKPSMKADTMLARFQSSGGTVEWDCYSDTKVAATFSHPRSPKPVYIEWTIERARGIMQESWEGSGQNARKVKKSLAEKDIWKAYPAPLMRARVISEGVRTLYPGVLCGLYTPEEVADMVDVEGISETTGPDIKPAQKPAQNPTPPVAPAWPELPALAEIKAKLAAMVTTAAVLEYWQSLRLDNGHPRFAEIRDVFSDARRRIEAAKAAPAPSQPTPPPYDTESAEFLLETMSAAERDTWLRDEKARMKWADADPIYTALRNVVAEMAKKEAPPAKREPMNAAPGKKATAASLAAAGYGGDDPTPFDDDLEAIE